MEHLTSHYDPALEASWRSPPERICVIGAGPSGLAALKVVRDSPRFKDGVWTVTAFEAREKVGGIWLPSPTTVDGTPPLTPLYDSLTTNLPHPVMAYTSFAFPPSTPLFPPASTVLTYVEDYATHFDLMQHVQLGTRVQSVTYNHTTTKWTVQVQAIETDIAETYSFDYVIVANGHYREPRLPSTSGLAQWVDAKKAMHSVFYRNPSDFGDARTVLVVGGGPSGQDLCSDLLASGRTVVSSVTGAVPEDLHDGRLKLRGRISHYDDIAEGRVTFVDGTEEVGIDRCVLATGYKMDLPFFSSSLLHRSLPPPVPPLPKTLYNSTYHVFPLAKHVFPLVGAEEFPPSSIAFLGLPIRVVPMPLVEAQMSAVLHVFEHPKSLDATQEAVDIVARYELLRSRVTSRLSPAPAVATWTDDFNSSPPVTNMTLVEPDGGEDVDIDGETSNGDRIERAIASAWLRFEAHEQFEYRDALHVFAGAPHRVPAWEVEMYDAKGVLREEWRDLERLGKAEEWVRGVGAGGDEKRTEEWVELMRKLLRRADERHPERSRL